MLRLAVQALARCLLPGGASRVAQVQPKRLELTRHESHTRRQLQLNDGITRLLRHVARYYPTWDERYADHLSGVHLSMPVSAGFDVRSVRPEDFST